jgi:hypothetical protein
MGDLKYGSSEESVGHRYVRMAGRKLGSRRRPTRCRIARLQLFIFVDSCLSNQFALSGKRYAVREDLSVWELLVARMITLFRLPALQETAEFLLEMRPA